MRKHIQANRKKANRIFDLAINNDQVVFSLKRKPGYQLSDNIQIDLNHDDQVAKYTSQRKQVQVGINELIELTQRLGLQEKDEKAVVLTKVEPLASDFLHKREFYAQSYQKEARKDFIAKSRQQSRARGDQLVIPLQQLGDQLVCPEASDLLRQTYEMEETDIDYYVLKTIDKDKLQQTNHTHMKLDFERLDSYLHHNPYEEEEEVDSEDSERTDNSKFDYPDESESEDLQSSENDNDPYSSRSDSREEQKTYYQQDIEVEDNEEGTVDTTLELMRFLSQHREYDKNRKDWKNFEYEKHF